jgi:iron-sulfur cluster assembly accessory protein
MDLSVTVSERAARRIGEILKTEPAGSMLRVSVEGGGCSGFQYKFGVEQARADDDLVIARDGAVVLIDPVSVDYMAGSEIDFVVDLIGASFKGSHPKATASCGGGTSFALAVKPANLYRPHGEERRAAARLEPPRPPILRDASLRDAPQDEAESYSAATAGGASTTSSSCGSSRRLSMRSKRSR